MKDEATYVCDSCGEEIVVPIDLTAGSRQEYVEDCPVCCRPNVIHHGQRSFLPTFSTSSLSPWTIRTPRFTCVSDGKPWRRLLIGSKKTASVRGLAGP